MAGVSPPLSGGVRQYAEAHPGRVERGGRVSGRGSPALADSLPYPHHLTEGQRGGDEDEAGRMTDGRGAALLFAVCWSIDCEMGARW